MVWALYPETNQRTLEEMNLVFACDSPWVWDAERNFAILKEENPGLVQAARRGSSVVDAKTRSPYDGVLASGEKDGSERRSSLVPQKQG